MPIIDQKNWSINEHRSYRRIISLVPSLTEYLWYLGLEEEVIGISKFCIKPQHWFKAKQRVGGTKSLNMAKIKSLNPDLILANKEENEKGQIEELAKSHTIYLSDIESLEESYDALRQIGQLVNREEKANLLIADIKLGMKALNQRMQGYSCLYFIWQKPYMVAGEQTFIDHILSQHGFKNLGRTISGRYPEVRDENRSDLDPDFIFLSSEPFPFAEKHLENFRKMFPQAKVLLVDGEAYSWYGSRMKESIPYFKRFYDSLTM